MINKIFFILVFSLGFVHSIFAQPEALSPLIQNQYLEKNKFISRTFQDIFVYEIDTVHLPFLDDFSRNRFKSYNAQPNDPNVSLQQYFRLLDQTGTIVLPVNDKYRKTQTYFILVDTVAGVTVQTLTPLDSIYITINSLTAYPVISNVDSVWPSYNIVDTAWLPSSPDTIWVTPDYVQDSLNVYFVTAAGDNSLWQDHFAYRNNRYPIGPPTIGVATFDGLNENGYPYDFVNTTLTGICDFLTSKPLNLGTKPSSLPYTAADSLYLSFYYQSMGRGNAPELGDSLILEFWAPDSLKWFRTWAVDGGVGLTDFKQVMVPIKSFFYLKNGFKFRFKNIGNLSGSLDHWHVDYVYLNSNRNQGDTIKQDVAFIYDALSLLKDFTAMPWNHFHWNPESFMADTMSVYQKNNDNVNRIIANQQISISYQGSPQGTINGPIIPNVNPNTFFSTLYDIQTAGFVYDTTGVDSCAARYDVNIVFNPGSNFQLNDTISFQQVFENYYAYDDGTAEAAYGPQGANARLAYKFFIPQFDTLRALRIHFEPSVTNVTNKPFFITVWDATGPGGTPGNILMENTSFLFPIYVDENNGFYEYELDQKVFLSGNYFVGWRQLNADRLNVGFDMNTNKQNKIYYNTSGAWLNTSFQGALMMRPVFTNCNDILMSVPEENFTSQEINIFPNPANESVQFSSNLNSFIVEVYDLTGKLLINETISGQPLSVVNLSNGVYILKFRSANGDYFSSKKLVISK